MPYSEHLVHCGNISTCLIAILNGPQREHNKAQAIATKNSCLSESKSFCCNCMEMWQSVSQPFASIQYKFAQ